MFQHYVQLLARGSLMTSYQTRASGRQRSSCCVLAFTFKPWDECKEWLQACRSIEIYKNQDRSVTLG